MNKIFSILFILIPAFLFSQNVTTIENVVIVTTDGFRWQEVFKGMDSTIANNKTFNQGKRKEIYNRYWAPGETERRKKLLPFIWEIMASSGQIYGNRLYQNNVDNYNPYWFSYPGYSEIFCGYVDTAINTNSYSPNPHTNVLEFLNKQPGFTGKVAAFGAWDAFDRILNEGRSRIPVICGADTIGGSHPDNEQILFNEMKKDSYLPFGTEEFLDVFTHYGAMDYLKKEQPRALYISYGETDEFAHEGRYLDYLDAAHHVDQWLNDLWNYIQSTSQYQNKTALFITVDHGRGDIIKENWTSHNSKIADSHEIWFAVIGPGIPVKGEIKESMHVYQQQFAQTFAELLGHKFTCEHPVADGLKSILLKK